MERQESISSPTSKSKDSTPHRDTGPVDKPKKVWKSEHADEAYWERLREEEDRRIDEAIERLPREQRQTFYNQRQSVYIDEETGEPVICCG
jgi:DNA-directed RNA polymerase specialized sigma24 family protein